MELICQWNPATGRFTAAVDRAEACGQPAEFVLTDYQYDVAVKEAWVCADHAMDAIAAASNLGRVEPFMGPRN